VKVASHGKSKRKRKERRRGRDTGADEIWGVGALSRGFAGARGRGLGLAIR
jgi:hypothetical protein